MNFVLDAPIKYKQIRMAQADNDAALELMGKFAVDETGTHYTPEAWQAITDELDFPGGIMEAWQEFQAAILPTMRHVAT
jgi:hypothetical protein